MRKPISVTVVNPLKFRVQPSSFALNVSDYLQLAMAAIVRIKDECKQHDEFKSDDVQTIFVSAERAQDGVRKMMWNVMAFHKQEAGLNSNRRQDHVTEN